MLNHKTRYQLLLGIITGVWLVGTGTFAWASPIVVNADFTRIPADVESGSGHTVLNQCMGTFEAASANLKILQQGSKSFVEIHINMAKPNTLYTVWLRVKGKDQNGNSFGGSPLTGGGATPLAPGAKLDSLIAISPFAPPPGNLGSATLANGFTTNAAGNGVFNTVLDFPVIGGAYPFNLANLPTPLAPGIPVAIVDPTSPGLSASSFLLRIVSHCQDGLGHGLSPGERESWFDYPS